MQLVCSIGIASRPRIAAETLHALQGSAFELSRAHLLLLCLIMAHSSMLKKNTSLNT